MNFSLKKATLHSFMGVAIGIAPAIITYLVAKGLWGDSEAVLATAIVGMVTTAFGTNRSNFRWIEKNESTLSKLSPPKFKTPEGGDEQN